MKRAADSFQPQLVEIITRAAREANTARGYVGQLYRISSKLAQRLIFVCQTGLVIAQDPDSFEVGIRTGDNSAVVSYESGTSFYNRLFESDDLINWSDSINLEFGIDGMGSFDKTLESTLTDTDAATF